MRSFGSWFFLFYIGFGVYCNLSVGSKKKAIDYLIKNFKYISKYEAGEGVIYAYVERDYWKHKSHALYLPFKKFSCKIVVPSHENKVQMSIFKNCKTPVVFGGPAVNVGWRPFL